MWLRKVIVMAVGDAQRDTKRLRGLQAEIAKLKKLLTELMFDIKAL